MPEIKNQNVKGKITNQNSKRKTNLSSRLFLIFMLSFSILFLMFDIPVLFPE
jgi:hypothetical protein